MRTCSSPSLVGAWCSSGSRAGLVRGPRDGRRMPQSPRAACRAGFARRLAQTRSSSSRPSLPPGRQKTRPARSHPGHPSARHPRWRLPDGRPRVTQTPHRSECSEECWRRFGGTPRPTRPAPLAPARSRHGSPQRSHPAGRTLKQPPSTRPLTDFLEVSGCHRGLSVPGSRSSPPLR